MKSQLSKLWKALGLPVDMQLHVMRVMHATFLIGLTGIFFNEKDEVLLFRHSYRAHSWSLPGGYLEAGEHPTEGLEREVQEESNLIVSADTPLKIRADRQTARLDLCYMGTFLGGNFKPTTEVTEYGFFPQDSMPLLRKNQIFLIDEALELRKKQVLLDS